MLYLSLEAVEDLRLDDLTRLRTSGVIVGKALWEGRVGISEALDAVA